MGSLVDSAALHYFDLLDPTHTTRVQAGEAASFLRSSGIADTDLAVIWDLSDREKVGSLDVQGLAIAIKLVALIQNGHSPHTENLHLNVPMAKFSGFTQPPSQVSSVSGTLTSSTPPPSRPIRPVLPDKTLSPDSWIVSPQARAQYDSIFHSLNPANGKLSGLKVKPILMKSQLHVNVLGQIWELSDVDKDGQLDIEEFSLAMHLLNKAREGEQPPTILTQHYIPPSHRVVYTKVHKVNWLVSVHTRKVAADEFSHADVRGSGALSGLELRPLLVRKGVPMVVLAKIWTLCDMGEAGKLNVEQYALALHLIDLHKIGNLPETLPLELIPPSMRATGVGGGSPQTVGTPNLPPRGSATLPAKQHPPRPGLDKNATLVYQRSTPPLSTLTPSSDSSFSSPSSMSVVSMPPPTSIPDELASLNLGSALDNADFSVIKELDTYTKETDGLTKEKQDLQTEIKAAEESLSSAGEELKDLKKQLTQLEEEVEKARKQRDEVQISLDEADAERRKYEELIADLHKKAVKERQQISVLQQQIASQDALRKSQEDELQKAREELTKLRQEESHYLHQVESGKRQLDSLIQNLKIVQNDTNLTQARLVQIEAAHRTMDKALAELAPFGKRCPGSEGKPSILTNIHEVSQLRRDEPDITQMSDITRATAGSSPVSSMSGISVDSYMETHYDASKNDQPPSSANPFGPVSSELFQGDLEPFSNEKQSNQLESESSGANEESGTNTPQLNRRNNHSSESAQLKIEEETEFLAAIGGFSNPFHGNEDPFQSSGFTEDPFANNPFGDKADPFSSNSENDPFGQNNLFADQIVEDPFTSSSMMEPPADPFATPSKSDPFGNSTGEDPFSGLKYNDMDDPFRETNLFPSERDAFNTHDPFANTADPFAGSTDLFKGSNTSLNSKGTRGSKNSLNNLKNYGSKNSLQGSKNSLNDSATTDSSPKLDKKSVDPAQIPDDTPTEKTLESELEMSNELSRDEDKFDLASETLEHTNPGPFVSSAPETDPFTDSKDVIEPFKDSGFGSDPFASSNGKESELFAEKDPFGESSDDPFATDPTDPFGPAPTFSTQFDENDPFTNSSKPVVKSDPFDPFSGSSEDTQVGFTATFS